ncbi:VOC family protein [Streptomyces sp. NBC_01020]|uniref:VOC family protein n=1 Tax=unclassified Streptomyces TaxID=2593676 RepID=UPI002E22305F|nr:VOC family protein [Streptomyces sp. NBC_01020]WSX69420.1 VOC family protein [Streptomyces sp. NBC_00932]
MAVAKLGAVVLDCPDPAALAAFYAAVIGGTVESNDPEWVSLTGLPGTQLDFQRSPGFVPPQWPSDDGSQQFHLDLTVEDLDAAEQQILALGAKALDAADRSRTFRVYADPAGHPFCLCAC